MDLPLPVEPTRIVEFTIYDIASGRPRCTYSGEFPDLQCKVGEDYVIGRWPAPRYVIDHATKTPTAVDVSPKAGKRWSDEARCFVATEESKASAEAIAKIELLEKSQARAAREKELGTMSQQEYRDRLKAIDDEIVALRAKL